MKKSKVLYSRMYQFPYAITHCLCSDGKQRYATVTSLHNPDAWSILASIKVYDKTSGISKTVSGFVTWDDDKEVHVFHNYTYGKNGHLLP
jgi:hypothetical protein